MKFNNRDNLFSLPTSFLDVLLNLSLVFLVLLILLLITMKTETTKTKIDAQAEFIITMTWPSGDWDMDIWVLPPNEKVVFYQNPTSSVLNIERDDTGTANDVFEINGETVTNPLNQEIVVVRGIYPGEYIINVHLYRTGPGKDTGYDSVTASGGTNEPGIQPQLLIKPIKVSVRVDKINPVIKTIYFSEVEITHNRQEQHVVKFRISADGNVSDISNDSIISLHDKTGLTVMSPNASGELQRFNYVPPATIEDMP